MAQVHCLALLLAPPASLDCAPSGPVVDGLGGLSWQLVSSASYSLSQWPQWLESEAQEVDGGLGGEVDSEWPPPRAPQVRGLGGCGPLVCLEQWCGPPLWCRLPVWCVRRS